MRYVFSILFTSLCVATTCGAQEKVYSGPQPGEKLTPFRVTGFFEPNAGKELDFVASSGGEPIVLVFIHDVNRMSLRFTQVLTSYSIGLVGVHTGVTWLADDVTEAENVLKRSGHALTREAPTGISREGREGPGAYGLNRNVSLTILIGKSDRVTANFALVQPSIQADLPKVLEAIAAVTGAKAATLEDLLIVQNIKLQGPLIRFASRDTTAQDVDRDAITIENVVKADEAARKELGRIARNLIEKGMLEKRGTPRAQEYLKKWATKYGDSISP